MDTPNSLDCVAVILAGGLGTRIRHLLGGIPKPMAPILGRPFIEWVIRYLRRQGVRRFAVSSGYQSEVIARYFATHPVPDSEIICVPETMPLGTGGGFINAVQESGFTSPVWLVANGDSLLLANIDTLLGGIQIESSSAGILALRVSDATRFGTLEVSSGTRLLQFTEKRGGAGLINGGVYVFKNQILSFFPSCRPLSFESQVFPSLLKNDVEINVQVADAPFLDIGTPASFSEAEQFIENNYGWFLNFDLK
jgi:D-glycero-alpha-D-manno-heptose 1-phosphate guanylyltransferase